MVKIEDEMTFKRGAQDVTFTGVPELIDPTSVRLAASGGNVVINEQNYRYDLVSPQKVLERYLDLPITLWLEGGELLEGVLQSAAGDVVIREADGGISIVRLDAIERFGFSELPGGLVTRPTLVWTVTSDRAGDLPTEVSYMTGGFNWHAEYMVVIADDEKSMELSSWVSINNNSGATFEDASLKLVAGDVHRAQPPMPSRAMLMKAEVATDQAAGGFEERGLFEYHLYELSGRTTVQNSEVKQIALFEPAEASVATRLVYDPRIDADNVTAMLEFTNSEKSGLGMPLPAGKVRVFTRDTDGAVEFIGEDRIDHTPKDDDVRLTLGSSFDITAERRVMDTRRISARVREETVEIELRNRKDKPVAVTAIERMWGDWEIVKSSDTFTKKDATTAECEVSIPADTTKTIIFTVRYQ